MSDIVNLRMARKRKARADKEQLATENRALHGRTKAEKDRDRLLGDQAATRLDGHFRGAKKDGGEA